MTVIAPRKICIFIRAAASADLLALAPFDVSIYRRRRRVSWDLAISAFLGWMIKLRRDGILTFSRFACRSFRWSPFTCLLPQRIMLLINIYAFRNTLRHNNSRYCGLFSSLQESISFLAAAERRTFRRIPDRVINQLNTNLITFGIVCGLSQ